jgi:hypothetical protein
MLLATKVPKFHLAPKISCMQDIWSFGKGVRKEEFVAYGC